MQKKDAAGPGFLPGFPHFATRAIHAGQDPEQWHSRAVVPLISLSTTFKQGAPGQHSGFVYSRSGNPTRSCLEKAVAALDEAKYSLAFASGLAATVTVTHLLKAGDEVICMDDVYAGVNRYFRRVAVEFGLKISYVDCSKTKLLEEAITPRTKLVWLETPTNPTLKLVDIAACAKIVRSHGDILLVVDNTFMSAYFQRPLALGADICMCSATKYMNGHSDVLMGLVSVNSEDLNDRLRFLQNTLGTVPSPLDCYLCLRGLKTLQIRMEKHFQNGMAVARFLESNPRVEKVLYPGLPSHPQHELAKRQCTGCPGMVTFYIKGSLQHAETFLQHLKLFTLAESLGGYESLAELPAIMTHSSVPRNDRETLGISDTLIRLSVGLEDESDLLEDLDQALKAAHPENGSPK
ncbi:cystathionine gamma-lyase [Heterocephalus glaber]|uniref:Cystathionine gamma-lyase n=1 Tax=Heterocephalus glaber TaxID=10181 RepID=A0A0A7HSH1_HETGA|nr:cystathionine gamma-lyase [Heterocephalus glaber]AIZ08981.1 cystathionine gamma-lyase [Heterocephalus glaber]